MWQLLLGFVNRIWKMTGQGLKQQLYSWTKPRQQCLIGGAVCDATRSKSERQVKRPHLNWRDRGIMVLLASRLRFWRVSVLIVKPETILRWHRDLFRRVWRWKSQAAQPIGRPTLSGDQVSLIRHIAHENTLWGAERIRGELLKLGIQVAKSTIQKYTQPVRLRGPQGQTWTTFLRNHASEIWACDFLQTYDVLFRSMFIFVIIELESRRVIHCNVTRHPTDAWIAQQWREATAYGQAPQYLICDNDRKFRTQFEQVTAGVEVLRTPIAAPKANAFCERFLGILRRECLDHLLTLSEHHLRRSLNEHVTYFNHARPHQGIEQHIPCVESQAECLKEGLIASKPVLGGLHHHYHRAA